MKEIMKRTLYLSIDKMLALLELAKTKSPVRLQRIVDDIKRRRSNRNIFSDLYWHEKMLADSVRVKSYKTAIRNIVKPGDVVLDLGTGTGLLAFFAASAGAKRVYAVDHSDFIKVAEEIGRQNGFENIEFVQKNSRDFETPERVDIIVHEQMGHVLFCENMVRNLIDLKQRVLKPGGRIIPAHFELFAVPVSLKPEYAVPHLWEIEDLGVNLSFLKEHEDIEDLISTLPKYRYLKNFEVDLFLAKPKRLIALNMNQIESGDDIKLSGSISWNIECDASLDGICFYFQAQFDDGTTFDTSPFSLQTSWESLLLKTPRHNIVEGNVLKCTLMLDPVDNADKWQVQDTQIFDSDSA